MPTDQVRDEIERHPNPDFQIRVRRADDIEFLWIADMFRRIQLSDIKDRPVVMIVPKSLSGRISKGSTPRQFVRGVVPQSSCFAMDEYANEEAPSGPKVGN